MKNKYKILKVVVNEPSSYSFDVFIKRNAPPWTTNTALGAYLGWFNSTLKMNFNSGAFSNPQVSNLGSCISNTFSNIPEDGLVQIELISSGEAVPTTSTRLLTVTMDIANPNTTAGLNWNDEDDPTAIYKSDENSIATTELLGDDDSSLPVELTSFTAANRSGGVLLKWTTESEIENLGFILQKQVLSSDNWILVSDYRKNSALEGHGSTSQRHDYEYTDTQVQPGATYEYRLGDVEYSSSLTWHGKVEVKVKVEDIKMPMEFGLKSVYPNPFNPETYIAFNLCDEAKISVCILDLLGRKVCNIVNEKRPVGSYTVIWDGRDNRGVRLSSGIYFVLMESGNMRSSRKVVLFR